MRTTPPMYRSGPSNFQQASGPHQRQYPQASGGKSSPNVTCFTCGEQGHYARTCPKKSSGASNPSATVPNRAQMPPMRTKSQNSKGATDANRGQAYHVDAEEAQHAPRMVMGTFPANTVPAIVLFDSGALHSFIPKKS